MQRLATSATTAVARSARVRLASSGSDSRLPTPESFTNLRTLGSLGPWMRDQPKEVKEMQKFFGHTNAPTYAKGPLDHYFNYGTLFLTGCGVLMTIDGLKDMMYGTNKSV